MVKAPSSLDLHIVILKNIGSQAFSRRTANQPGIAENDMAVLQSGTTGDVNI
jgi:hypothetical protein